MGLPSASLVGRTIRGGKDAYRITRHLGSGGMGDVYEAYEAYEARAESSNGGETLEHQDQQQRVAIKVLTIEDPSTCNRFRQEALALSKLAMPHVVRIIDFVLGEKEAFLVMELLHGETLFDVLRRGKTLGMGRALHITAQVLEALSATHAAGIVHRDVKPSNIFLVREDEEHGGGGDDNNGRDDVVKLIDFGVAKVLSGGLVSTTLGVVVGTPAYMAPEQLRTGRAVPASDLHAVGVCLFQMLTGRRPWRANVGSDLTAEILREEALTLAESRPDLPRGLDAAIRRALAKNPRDRFESADAMSAALEPYAGMHLPEDLGFEQAEAGTQSIDPTTRKQVVAAGAGAAGAAGPERARKQTRRAAPGSDPPSLFSDLSTRTHTVTAVMVGLVAALGIFCILIGLVVALRSSKPVGEPPQPRVPVIESASLAPPPPPPRQTQPASTTTTTAPPPSPRAIPRAAPRSPTPGSGAELM